jgi:hypothetical protein
MWIKITWKPDLVQTTCLVIIATMFGELFCLIHSLFQFMAMPKITCLTLIDRPVKSYWRERLSTIDLLVRTCLYQLFVKGKILITFLTKQTKFIRRLTVLSFPLSYYILQSHTQSRISNCNNSYTKNFNICNKHCHNWLKYIAITKSSYPFVVIVIMA